jgi:hypothetical protein
MPALYGLTFAVNLLGLVLALWLGLYLVTRSPRLWLAWLTALTLWSLAGVFLNILLALTPPPAMRFYPELMRFVFLFWPEEALAESRSQWLQGWSVAPAAVFWHHATVLMRPGGLNVWRWVRIWAGYLLAILAIIAQANASILYTPEDSNPLYLNSLQAGPWYSFFGLALVILTLYSAVNLLRSTRSAPSKVLRNSFSLMAFATLVAGVVAPFSILGSMLGLPVPMVVISLFVLIPMIIIGYDVARYSAMMEGHTIQRDFYYNLLLLGLVVLVYLSVSAILVVAYQAPQAIVIIIPVLAVLTHSLVSTAARLLDRMFFRQEARQLRSNLQRLIRLAVEETDLDESLVQTLESLCNNARSTYGMILTFQSGSVWQVAAYHWYGGPITLKTTDLAADDVIHLKPGQLQPPLEEAALLVPLYTEAEQVGALLLGRPVNGIRYSEDEVTNLLNLTDRMGEILASARRKAEKLSQIAHLTEPSPLQGADFPVTAEMVEDALRNLYDYTWLADSPLAQMRLVGTRLLAGKVTHLERGKAVHDVVLQAIDKLRPGGEIPRDPPPREWYPYRILYDAYLREISNREIMMHLYISEGTFNRTRRSAIRSLARALSEMETNSAPTDLPLGL